MLKARTQLLFKHPFFATLILKLQFIIREQWQLQCGTMETDGKHLWYCQAFLDQITTPEIMGVLSHEALHCALHHPTRCGTRNPEKWNRAIDYVVNILVLDASLKLPEGCLLDYEFRNMTAEKVYDLLPDEPEDEQPQGGGRMGEVIEPCDENGQPLSSGEIKQIEGEWQMAVKQATEIATGQGKMPQNIVETIEDMNKEPQVPWQEEFRYFMTTPAQDDYSWSRPNRRFVYQNIYLPSHYSLAMGTVVWATDSSGSVGQNEFEAFGAEFNGVVEETQPATVWAMFCDTELHGVKEYTPEDFPINEMKPIGRGGTHFNKPFEWVIEQGIRPDCFVYLTDLCGQCTVETPDYPVLWINTSPSLGQDDVPFGKVITIDV